MAEDDPVNQIVTSETLMQLGFKVDLVAIGADAVEHALAGGYALVLMDVHMPVMDSLQATRLIRQHPGMQALPIVAMTAHAFDDDRKRCLEAGIDKHVAKPIALASSHAALVMCLGGAWAVPGAVPGAGLGIGCPPCFLLSTGRSGVWQRAAGFEEGLEVRENLRPAA